MQEIIPKASYVGYCGWNWEDKIRFLQRIPLSKLAKWTGGPEYGVQTPLVNSSNMEYSIRSGLTLSPAILVVVNSIGFLTMPLVPDPDLLLRYRLRYRPTCVHGLWYCKSSRWKSDIRIGPGRPGSVPWNEHCGLQYPPEHGVLRAEDGHVKVGSARKCLTGAKVNSVYSTPYCMVACVLYSGLHACLLEWTLSQIYLTSGKMIFPVQP